MYCICWGCRRRRWRFWLGRGDDWGGELEGEGEVLFIPSFNALCVSMFSFIAVAVW